MYYICDLYVCNSNIKITLDVFNDRLGCVLQAQIVEDDKLSQSRKSLHTIFNICPDINEDYGGLPSKPYTEEELDVDAFNDPALREKLAAGQVPLVDTIVRCVGLCTKT